VYEDDVDWVKGLTMNTNFFDVCPVPFNRFDLKPINVPTSILTANL